MARRKCKGGCDWQPLPRSFYERCTVCRDVFPCRSACGHLDCIETRIINGRATSKDFDVRNTFVTKHPIKGPVDFDQGGADAG